MLDQAKRLKNEKQLDVYGYLRWWHREKYRNGVNYAANGATK